MKTEFNFKNPGESFKGFCRPEILTYRDFSFINLNCSPLISLVLSLVS